MAAKIVDVARLAGVSVPTVSRVLNGNKYVSDELTDKVLKAVKTLNYFPNLNARGLASRKTKTIGLVVPFLDESTSRFLTSCSSTLEKSGYELMIGKSGKNIETEYGLIESHLSFLISGIILVSPVFSRKTVLTLSKMDIPVIFAYGEPPAEGFHARLFDNRKAAFDLLSSITVLPSSKVSILSGPFCDNIYAKRIEGCRDALSGNKDYSIHECGGSLEEGYSKTLELLHTEIPDLMVCLSDFMAIGALRAAHEAGVAVPQQMQVTGFGKTEASEISTPTLTTVQFDHYRLGRECAESMIDLIEERTIRRILVFEHEIVKAESCLLAEGEKQ